MGVAGEAMWELILAGDWACSNADDETLERVAARIAQRLAGDLRDGALRVAALAQRDLTQASSNWGVLAVALRAREERAPE